MFVSGREKEREGGREGGREGVSEGVFKRANRDSGLVIGKAGASEQPSYIGPPRASTERLGPYLAS